MTGTGTGAGAGAGAGTSIDIWRTGAGGEGSGADAGVGGGALSDFVTMGEGVGVDAWCPGAVDPVERSTRIRGADFPAKNSAAEMDDSVDGAGGNMSAWKESAWRGEESLGRIGWRNIKQMYVLFVGR